MLVNLSKELTELRRAILTMGATVEQRVNDAIDALFQRDTELAQQVRRGDNEIDQMELDIEQECLRLLALSAPVASDLRFILAVMRINTELERLADNAKTLSKRAISMSKLAPIDLPPALTDMAEASRAMLADVLSALADEESADARRVRGADRRVDDLHREVFAWVQEKIPRDVNCAAAAIEILSVARKLERIGDLCTNIAEDVIFIVEGRIVRHAKI